MIVFPQPFVWNQYTPQYSSSGGLPVGEHLVVIQSGDWKPANSGKGQNAMLELLCVDGAAKGSTQKDFLPIIHEAQQTERIARQQLAAYCLVCGVPAGAQIASIADIAGRPFRVVVGEQPRKIDANGQPMPVYTEIKELRFADGRTIAQALQGQPQTGQPPMSPHGQGVPAVGAAPQVYQPVGAPPMQPASVPTFSAPAQPMGQPGQPAQPAQMGPPQGNWNGQGQPTQPAMQPQQAAGTPGNWTPGAAPSGNGPGWSPPR